MKLGGTGDFPRGKLNADDEGGGGFAAKKALEWALDWCALNGIAVEPEPAPTEAA